MFLSDDSEFCSQDQCLQKGDFPVKLGVLVVMPVKFAVFWGMTPLYFGTYIPNCMA